MIAGSIYMFAGSTAPTGFLLCDGSAVSRSTYSNLFDAIGTTFGTGDGSTTFNLPDMAGRVAMGASTNYAMGATGGSETHTLVASEIAAHTHSIGTHGHANTIKATTPKFVHSITAQPAFNYSKPNTTTGAGSQLSNRCYNGTTSSTASRSTAASITAHAAANCTMSGGITDCDAFNMEDSGSDTAHENMQPYITLNYIISTGD